MRTNRKKNNIHQKANHPFEIIQGSFKKGWKMNKINNVTMTILVKPKRTFLDSLIYRVKSLFLRA